MLSESILIRLQHQHLGIRETISRVSAAELTQRPAMGKWSIQENLGHLVSYQLEFIRRIQHILDIERPSLHRYVGDDDPDFEKTRKMVTANLLEKMETDRYTILERIQQLSQEELTRTGTHPVYGELAVSEWTEFFLLHEAHHMLTIFKLVHSAPLHVR